MTAQTEPTFDLELTVSQLLDLAPEQWKTIGDLVNMMWENHVMAGAHHPWDHALNLEELGPDYCVNGYGERGCGGVDECIVLDRGDSEQLGEIVPGDDHPAAQHSTNAELRALAAVHGINAPKSWGRQSLVRALWKAGVL